MTPLRLGRRSFLQKAALAAAGLAAVKVPKLTAHTLSAKPGPTDHRPWFRRLTRWGQTNITEMDPRHYDVAWWRQHWRRTETQGVIVNAGGIVAYYPSQVPFHRPAQYLEGRDLFGELCRAAQEDGLAVLARMDSNRAHADFYQAHPDYFAIDNSGQPHRAGELFVACVNGPYYEQHLPGILREIIDRYHPDGFADNSWSGLGRGSPCFCDHCQRRFHERTGQAIPREKNWDDPTYRRWLEWNYERRLELWDLNNRVTKAAGGPNCIWVGMNSGSVAGQCRSFRDYKEICRRAELILLDHQARDNTSGFQNNGETGKLIHGLVGWDKLIPESMAMYQAGKPTFRLASKPEPEARLWMVDGIAGGLQPWWHHVGAYPEDRRMYRTAESVYRWHKANEPFLIDRRPVATVGVVWSQRNTDYYGRDDAELLVELPWRGLAQALIRARIPYLPVHADYVERDASQFSLLILPNLGAMSDDQLAAVRGFVNRGGGLLATGESGLFDEWGDPRPNFALGDLFGVHLSAPQLSRNDANRRKWANETYHTYLRLSPAMSASGYRPKAGKEPSALRLRHEVLRGFEETDLLPFGGMLGPVTVAAGAQVLMTFVPPFPIYPPETAWMREPKTDIPGLILNTMGASRIAFLPADLDRRFGRDNLPDHGNLLANLVRWAAKDDIPLAIEGHGLIDCHMYCQPGRLILHLVNLTNTATWRQPVDELLPIGPLKVRVKLPGDVHGRHARLLVAGHTLAVRKAGGWGQIELDAVLDHEVAVLT